jgi:hypothetical protein
MSAAPLGLGLLLAGGLLAVSLSHADTLYVARRGWHIDVGFAVDELQRPLGSVAAEFPEARYVFFGFADRRYLMSKHHSVPALLAAVWPGEGILLATGLAASPAAAFGEPHVIAIPVSPEELGAVQRMVWDALSQSQADIMGKGYAGLPGPYSGSLYLSSRVRYSGFHTCNTWAAEVIKGARLPVRAKGVIFAGQLWGQVRRLVAADRTAASGVR